MSCQPIVQFQLRVYAAKNGIYKNHRYLDIYYFGLNENRRCYVVQLTPTHRLYPKLLQPLSTRIYRCFCIPSDTCVPLIFRIYTFFFSSPSITSVVLVLPLKLKCQLWLFLFGCERCGNLPFFARRNVEISHVEYIWDAYYLFLVYVRTTSHCMMADGRIYLRRRYD